MHTTIRQTRGDATREALIQAGVEVFGRAGYDAASSRMLATEAGVNQALINYHFGGKHGLYLAVFEHVADQFGREIAPAAQALAAELVRIETAPRGRRARCIAAAESVLAALFEVLSQPRTVGWARLIVREQQQPTEAFDILYDGLMGRMLGLLTRLVAIATEDDADGERARLCALMLVGQVLMFRVAHAAVRRHMRWGGEYGDAERAAVLDQLRIHVAAILDRRVCR